MTEITVGSVAFFDGMEGFKPQVTDKVVIVKQVPNGWWHHKQTKQHIRLFEWQQHTLSELVAKLSAVTAVKDTQTDAADLTAIAPVIQTICGRHEWAKTVYDAYVQNGSLTLTEAQRQDAFEAYKKTHQNIINA